ncbi:MAG: O-antigen ligase family protein [Solirubrobacteraceae bacterium]
MTSGPPALLRVRAGLLISARITLLFSPTALAFFAGGYFDEARAWAGLVAWLLVAVAVGLRAGPAPRGRAAWVTIAGMALLAAWTLVSMVWAPLAGSAYHSGQLVLIYLGILVASFLLLASPAARVWVEPALALGTLIVIGYALSERLLPGLLHFSRSISAQGRLEQPLTYWNAMGELAALGFVLWARLAGSAERPRWMRATAAAACAPLGLGLYLSFSRGALFACLAGLVALLVAAPTRSQLRALAVTVLAGVVTSAVIGSLHGFTAFAGGLSARERDGAIAMGVLIALMLVAGAAQWFVARRETRGVGEVADPDSRRSGGLRLPRGAPWIALVLVCGGLAGAILVGAKETTTAPALSNGVSRLTSLQSNRYAYWRVALRAFGDEPVRGVGGGGWAVWWLRYRTVNAFAQDAHSLPLQTAAELGLVGLVLLGMLFGGAAAVARQVHRAAPALAAGPIAALVAYAVHAPLDWDWQMPAVTLVAVVLAGMLLGATAPPRSAEPRA